MNSDENFYYDEISFSSDNVNNSSDITSTEDEAEMEQEPDNDDSILTILVYISYEHHTRE